MKRNNFLHKTINITLTAGMVLLLCACFDDTSVFDLDDVEPDPPKEVSLQSHSDTDVESDDVNVIKDSDDENVDNDDNVISSDEDTEDGKKTDSDGSGQGYFKTEDINGNIVTQEVFTYADINFVNVWGTFCGPCLSEMPDLGELASEYDSSEVQFIGIVCDAYDSSYSKEVKALVKEVGADNYMHLITNDDIVEWGLNDVEYVPTTFIVDSDGNILYETVGSHSKSEWKTLIYSYLK